jgi:hypothetical protein
MARVLCIYCFCLLYNLMLEPIHATVNCSPVWNRHVIELSSEFTTTLLVETVFSYVYLK